MRRTRSLPGARSYATRATARGSALGAVFALAACSDPAGPERSASVDAGIGAALTAQEMFARYVALGTSNSEGVQSAGISAASQRAAWPAQLARRAGVPFTLPLISDPGCGPPLVPPLATGLALIGAFGDDLVTAVASICAPLQSGITLPTNSVAISGAKARTALHTTPEIETARHARKGELYSRVLPPGHTQVTAMLAQRPTFVSVELAANEVLPASTGRISAMTPFADWQRDYDEILAAVKSTGARAVVVGLPNDAATFPSVRRAREFFDQWASLLPLRIQASVSCYLSPNHVFVPGYLLTLISKAPVTATCADVPGAVDYVLTPADMKAINAQMARMNTHMRTRARENGWAYFSIETLYGMPKPRFSVSDLVLSSHPFGRYISLDGVHPTADGQAILAAEAARVIGATYGVKIP